MNLSTKKANRRANTSYLGFLSLSLLLILGCGPGSKSLSPEEKASLQAEYDNLQDSLQLTWDQMTAADDERYADLKRLLEEVTYTGNYDSAQVAAYQARLDAVLASRYEQYSMTNAEIDQYDLASDSITLEILNYAKNHPDYEGYPTMGTLVTKVEGNSALMPRIYYSDVAIKRNEFLEKYKRIMSELEQDSSKIIILQTFYITE